MNIVEPIRSQEKVKEIYTHLKEKNDREEKTDSFYGNPRSRTDLSQMRTRQRGKRENGLGMYPLPKIL